MKAQQKIVKFQVFLSDLYINKFINARLKLENVSAKDLKTRLIFLLNHVLNVQSFPSKRKNKFA